MNKDYKLRRTILTAMHRVGKTAGLREIAAALGAEHPSRNKLAALRMMLLVMEREGVVSRLGSNVYRGRCGSGWGGMGSGGEIVECISACLQECHGVAQVDDILGMFADPRVWGPDEQEGQRLYIRRIIAEADCFQQYFEGHQEFLRLSRAPGQGAGLF